ncbi:hypothetical protein CTAYLR_010459 [Chrysophaeum taylorii]|uniref:Uncharacterized protein n=1 Tax=Chrysophaeum taylorii TaxID=2483200 RepID=A0AAD7U6U4_9STRA|nr:hypothetical protein CTAYLR_010459 [Chrysophaeum taylorii]
MYPNIAMRLSLHALSLLGAIAEAARVDVFHLYSHRDATYPLEAGHFRNLGSTARLEVVGHLNVTLDLRRDTEAFSNGYKELEFRGSVFHTKRSGAPWCHYVGTATVHNRTNRVRASVCSGALSAVFGFVDEHGEQRLAEIRWVDNKHHEIVVSGNAGGVLISQDRSSDTKTVVLEPKNEGNRGAESERRLQAEECGPGDTSTKWVSVVVFNDAARYARRGVDTEEQTALIFALVRDLYDGSTIAGRGLRGDGSILGCYVQPQLVGQITWREENPEDLEYASGSSCSDCGDGDSCTDEEVSSSCLLESFQQFTADQRDAIEETLGTEFDAAHLFTGADLDGQRAGLAYKSTLCTNFGVAIDSTYAYDGALHAATLVSHELGHNLGMEHDPEIGNIMGETWTGGVDIAEYQWSNYSREDAAEFFADTYGGSGSRCLDDEPAFDDDGLWAIDDIVETTCGDGIVDANEECDPGIGVVDACCLDDCTLDEDCECSLTDACCDEEGKLMAAGETCRAAVHDACDVEEVCDGVSAECPTDLYVSAGETCASNLSGADGKCYRGTCVAEDDNCVDYVTTSGEAAPILCTDISECSFFYCAAEGSSSCYSFGDPMLDGTPCGSNGQCIQTAFEDTTYAYADPSASSCVESSEIKDYHWYVPSDPCEAEAQCVDETSAVVEDFLCEDEKPEQPGSCTSEPTVSPVPTVTSRPSSGPSFPPSSNPTMSPAPSGSPTANREAGGASDGNSNNVVSWFNKRSFALKVVAVVVIVIIFTCCCVGCWRSSGGIPKRTASQRHRGSRQEPAVTHALPSGFPPMPVGTPEYVQHEVEVVAVPAREPGQVNLPASTRRNSRTRNNAADRKPSGRRPQPTVPTTQAYYSPAMVGAYPRYETAQPSSSLQEEQDRQLAAALAASDDYSDSAYFQHEPRAPPYPPNHYPLYTSDV